NNGWSGTWSQTGTTMTVKDAGWNGSLATNGSTGIGFIGNEHPAGTNPIPTSFTLNGQSCNHPAPSVAITSPAPGTASTAPANIPLQASARAATGSTMAQVAYFAGTTLIGTATTAPYTFNWTNVAAGAHNVTAVATDSLGAQGVSTPLGIQVAASPTVLLS